MAYNILTTHAGHGGKKIDGEWSDKGQVALDRNEADVAREINKKIVKMSGAKDVSDNKGKSEKEIVDNVLAKIDADQDGWNLSNHVNASIDMSNGVEVWYWGGSEIAKNKAEKVAQSISEASGIFNRGAKATQEFDLLKGSNEKTLMINWFYISNYQDINKMLPNLDMVIEKVLENFVDESVKEEGKEVTIEVGDSVKVLQTASKYENGEKIQSFVRNSSYKVKKVKVKNELNYYLLDNINKWVVESDLEKESVSMKKHIVKKGETLWGIAKENDTTIAELKELNDLKSEALIAGQTLIISE